MLDFFTTFTIFELKKSYFCRKTYSGAVKTASYVSIGVFSRKTFFLEELIIFYQSRTLIEEFLAFSQKTFCRALKTAFCVSIRNSLMKKFILDRKILFSFPDKEPEKFCFSWKWIQGGCQGCNTSGFHPSEHFDDRNSFQKKYDISQHFLKLCVKLSTTCSKNFRGVVKTAIYVSRGTFLLFLENDKFFILFRLWTTFCFGIKLKSFGRGFENCLLWVQTYILKKNKYFGNNKNF